MEMAGKCFDDAEAVTCLPFSVIAAELSYQDVILEAIDAADQAPWRRLL
jgi:hypothetical protein